MKRAGELLKQVEPACGARTDLGTVPSRGSRMKAAEEAGPVRAPGQNGPTPRKCPIRANEQSRRNHDFSSAVGRPPRLPFDLLDAMFKGVGWSQSSTPFFSFCDWRSLVERPLPSAAGLEAPEKQSRSLEPFAQPVGAHGGQNRQHAARQTYRYLTFCKLAEGPPRRCQCDAECLSAVSECGPYVSAGHPS